MACSVRHSGKGHVNPCSLFSVAGYDIFVRTCSSGMHFLQMELPQGRVTGSCRGYEHCGHCVSRTICRASFEASSGPVGEGGSESDECVKVLDEVRWRGNVEFNGREDIEGGSGGDKQDCPQQRPETKTIISLQCHRSRLWPSRTFQPRSWCDRKHASCDCGCKKLVGSVPDVGE